MSKAAITHTLSRRRLLASAPADLVLSSAVASAPVAQNPDAELIRVCQQFADAKYADWYPNITTDDREIERQSENAPVDWATVVLRDNQGENRIASPRNAPVGAASWAWFRSG